eukprot:4622532-Pyramimonas_sp.AAC.1
MECAGSVPTQLIAVIAALIPQHASSGEGPSYRSVGLMPRAYRIRARMRQEVARRWGRQRHLSLAHQAGRSVLELVYQTSLQPESNHAQDISLRAASI